MDRNIPGGLGLRKEAAAWATLLRQALARFPKMSLRKATMLTNQRYAHKTVTALDNLANARHQRAAKNFVTGPTPMTAKRTTRRTPVIRGYKNTGWRLVDAPSGMPLKVVSSPLHTGNKFDFMSLDEARNMPRSILRGDGIVSLTGSHRMSPFKNIRPSTVADTPLAK